MVSKSIEWTRLISFSIVSLVSASEGISLGTLGAVELRSRNSRMSVVSVNILSSCGTDREGIVPFGLIFRYSGSKLSALTARLYQ